MNGFSNWQKWLALTFLLGGHTVFAQTWVQSTAPTNYWSSTVCSADGAKIFACAGGGKVWTGFRSPIYISADAGLTWSQTAAPSNYWASIAISADGLNLVAAGGSSTKSAGIYTSTNGGLNWISNNISPQQWSSVASSVDGNKLFAVTLSGQFFNSTNSGNTWSSNAAPNGSWAIACSSDGNKLIAAPGNFGGYLCTSTNSGKNWKTNTSISSRIWWNVASSADGSILAAVDGAGGPGSRVFSSTNSGTTWATNSLPFLWSWQNVAMSANGGKLIAAAWQGSAGPGPIYTSTDFGANWISNSIPSAFWQGLSCSANGNNWVAISAGTNLGGIGKGSIWISQTPPLNALKISSPGNLQLSWTIPSTNLVLQQNADLLTTNWLDVTNVPVVDLTNLQNQVVLPLPSNNSFFRLKTQ
jgi:hypothetical protein